MSANHYPRNGLTQPFEGYPAFGAVHDVVPTEDLRSFLFDFSRIADLAIKQTLCDEKPAEITPDDFDESDYFARAFADLPHQDWEDYDSRHFYKIFDPDTLGISVVEMDGSSRAAKTVRAVWERHDFGAVEQEAKDAVNRQTGLFIPKVQFDNAMGVGRRLPGVDRAEIRQKLALLPDTSYHPETTELLELEADKINAAIRRRLRQFIEPWDTIPHLTFSVFRQSVSSELIGVVERSTKNFIGKFPFSVRLGDLSFRHKATRSKPKR